MTERLTLLMVLAHPDDEVWMASAAAQYAAQGIYTVLVTATLGEEGEIHDPDLDPVEARERLSEIREAELRRSVEIIGISKLHILGFRDSGMAGTPANQDPRNFHNADPQEAVRRLVRIIREERPQVIVTDNERGTYGHPDHLAANRTTLAAFDAAGDPNQSSGVGPAPWQPQKLYYTAFARSDFIRMRDLLRKRGIEWGGDEVSEDMFDFTVPDEAITTRVESHLPGSVMREAMRAHRTQISADDPMLNLPDDLAAQLAVSSSFTRVRSLVDAPLPETDLFAGLR